MELSLRKARKLEVKIQTYLDTKTLETKASVRTLGNIEEAGESVSQARIKTIKDLEERNQLIDTRYFIRRMIAQQNEKSGINALLGDKVLTERKIKELEDIGQTPAFTANELEDQLKAYSSVLSTGAVETDRWGGSKSKPKTSFKVPVLSKEDIDNFETSKTDFQRRLEQIDDDLSVKNIQTKVVLSEDNTTLLESHRLL